MKTRKGILTYVPWLAIFCFLVVSVGMIVWAVGTDRAFSSTQTILSFLGISSSSTTISTIHSAGIGAVVVCMLYSLLMVFMNLGRKSLERRIDEQGKAACGTWLWLAVEALMASVWWIVVFWMVFVIFGSCLWYGAAYTIWGSLKYTISQANATAAATATATYCPSACFNSAYFTYTISYVRDSCICDPGTLTKALNAANSAATALHLTVAGAFVMWVGSSFLLMVSVAGFATTKRERELLLRAQRNAAEAGASNFRTNVVDNPYYNTKDTLPLLAPQMQPQQQMPQMSQQQMQQAAQHHAVQMAASASVQPQVQGQ